MAQATTAVLQTTPTSSPNPSLIYLETGADFVIPVVFPDYVIHVYDAQEVDIFGRKIKTPSVKVPELGHAGVLIVNGKTGSTRYGEYGRYSGGGKVPGVVKIRPVPDVAIKDSAITESSLKRTLKHLSAKAGQSGPISGVVLRGDVFEKAVEWLNKKERENNDPNRAPYNLRNHNCITFVADLVDELGLDSPFRGPVVVPSLFIKQFQRTKPDLKYSYQTDTLEISE